MKLAAVWLVLLACGGGTAGGSFLVEWEIMSNGAPAECFEVGVFDVEVVTTETGGGQLREKFPCEDGMAITSLRAPGAYSIDVNALDFGDTVLATSRETGTILDGQSTDLGTFPLIFGAEGCDSSSCAFGCCQGNTCIDPPSDTACGTSGEVCRNCANLGQICEPIGGFCID